MAKVKTIINFNEEDLEHVGYVKTLLERLHKQVWDYREEEGEDYPFDDFSNDITKETMELLGDINDYWESIF